MIRYALLAYENTGGNSNTNKDIYKKRYLFRVLGIQGILMS